jgi:ABC-2 type transport system permease protein
MRQIWLIARQEFIKYVTRRGFLLSVLMFPLWIVIVVMVPKWTGTDSDVPRAHLFTVVDRSGGAYAEALSCAPGEAADRRWLEGAKHYAATLTVHAPDISKMAAKGEGACAPALDRPRIEAVLRATKKPGAPAFVGLDDGPALMPVAPGDLRDTPPNAFAAAARRAFAVESSGGVPLDTIIVIPKDFAEGGTAEIWTDNRDPEFRDFIRTVLTRELRYRAVHAAAPEFADRDALDVSAPVHVEDPTARPDADFASGQMISIALAVILFVVSVMNSSVLLQGVIEEKSNRMAEVLLSCATPRQITTGKLAGVITVALFTLLIWGATLLVMMLLAGAGQVATVEGALRAAASLDTLPLLLLYFLGGLLIYGSLFLAIGSMANSLADAQSLLGPSMLILMLPNLMIGGVMHAPNGPLATWLTFVPVYTPFFMMLRLASHPPAWQIWSATLLILATTAFMIRWSGRVFAKHILSTERPPALSGLLKGLLSRR